MRDLTRANELIATIAKQCPEITPITSEDFGLFQSFFVKEPHTYGNSWTYITQGMYGIGPNKLGYKYYDGENLSAITVYPRVEDPSIHILFWIRPMGKTVVQRLAETSKNIRSSFSIPVYAKKIFRNQYDELLNEGFQDIAAFPWHSRYVKEDDTFPELIIDLAKTTSKATHRNLDERLGSSYRYFEQYIQSGSVENTTLKGHESEAKKIIEDFFAYSHLYTKLPVISDPFDYFSMIEGKAQHETTIDQFIYFEGAPIGFYFLEKQTSDIASLYALITLRERSNHIVDYFIFDAMKKLKESGITKMNLGGSENENLNFFKNKFLPVQEIQMHWAVMI